MTNATQYLEAAKIDQVAAELEAQGYQVTREPQGPNPRYDLIAVKNGQTIAVEVKARSALRDSSEEIRRLREQAAQLGYTEFRLIVANPPREKRIEIEGLEEAFMNYFSENPTPEDLYDLASQPFIESISDIEADSIIISENGIRVAGSGFMYVELNQGGGERRDGVTWNMSLPFTFDVMLNRNLVIEEEFMLRVDTSSWYD